MAEVALSIGGRSYAIACRDGGEEHLRTLAAHVDRKAQEAAAAVGGMSEVRQILIAALLLADEFAEQAAVVPTTANDAPAAHVLGKLADRIEAVAEALEKRGKTA